MKKETFVKIINAVIEQGERDNAFNSALEPYFESWVMNSIANQFSSEIVEALEDEMCDSDVISVISWWLYDAPDAGRYKELAYIESDKVKIPLETPEQLFDYLEKYRKENENG
uniref:Uncharacterized protein n=1 Tax=viral metagenome TaxID=1070528 RepID=A0A6M3LWQ5_9ZZZZ